MSQTTIKAKREFIGYSKKELAACAHVSVHRITQMEAGQPVSREDALKVCKVLIISLEDVTGLVLKEEETPEKKAYKLFDESQKPETPDQRSDAIVRQLWNMGYIIRPMNTLIIGPTDFDDAQTEHLNAGSKEWGLMDRATRLPVPRPLPSSPTS